MLRQDDVLKDKQPAFFNFGALFCSELEMEVKNMKGRHSGATSGKY